MLVLDQYLSNVNASLICSMCFAHRVPGRLRIVLYLEHLVRGVCVCKCLALGGVTSVTALSVREAVCLCLHLSYVELQRLV